MGHHLKIAVLVAACALGYGCGEDESGTTTATNSSAAAGAGSEGGGGPACGDFSQAFVAAECRACAEASCCAELVPCAFGTTCAELMLCEADCADDACLQGCATTFPASEEAALLESCMSSQCAAPCAPAAGICSSGLTTNDDACDTCFGASCCEAFESCAMSDTCSACLVGTPTATGCDEEPLLAPIETCLHGACSAECGPLF